jgi:thiol-disulfide isomerase/thioredoxin
MIETRRSLIAAAAAFGICGKAAAATPPDPRPRSYAMLGQPAAAFDFPKLGGGRATLADYAGKVLILSFGGLWCPDCILDGAAVARLSHLADEDADVDFLEIHTRNRFGRWGANQRERAGVAPYNAEESARALNAYFAEMGHRYPVAFDASRDWTAVHYGLEWYPTYIIIDRAGIIRAWRTDLDTEANASAFFAAARRIAG